MKARNILITVSAVPLMLALAGCEHTKNMAGGPDGGGSTPVQGDLVADGTYANVADAVNAGETLKADPKSNSSMLLINHTDGTVTASNPSFSVKQNGGGVDVTVNGETVTFAAADVGPDPVNDAPYGWEKTGPDSGADLYSYNGKKDGSDTGYMQVWGYTAYEDDESARGYAVVGLETPESTVKSHANATYKGSAGFEAFQATDPSAGKRVRGDLTLNADFAGGKVSGSIDALNSRDRIPGGWTKPPQPVAGSIALGDAAISSNGFSGGALSLDAAAKTSLNVTDASGSTYSGRFYGPDAEQVGGVMNIKGTDAGGEAFVGTGYLQGSKQ